MPKKNAESNWYLLAVAGLFVVTVAAGVERLAAALLDVEVVNVGVEVVDVEVVVVVVAVV